MGGTLASGAACGCAMTPDDAYQARALLSSLLIADGGLADADDPSGCITAGDGYGYTIAVDERSCGIRITRWCPDGGMRRPIGVYDLCRCALGLRRWLGDHDETVHTQPV